MQVLIANGITTVLNMGGASSAFVDQVVPTVNAARRPGPHTYLAFRVDGTPEYGELVVATPEQARAVVGLAKTNGYDFIKVYNNLAPDVFEALVEEGRRQGIPVVGHGVTRVGIERQLAAGQLMVAHLEEYLYTVFFPAGADVGTRAPDESQIADAVAFTRRSGAFVTADLFTYATIASQWGQPDVVTVYFDDPDFAYLDPDMRIAWRRSGYQRREGDLGPRLYFLTHFAKALVDAGVPLIAGTDTPTIPGDYPGASLRADLYALHEQAGFTTFQALSTATRTPGEFIARAKPGATCFGVVAVGCRADLILLDDNPLDDLHALERRDGVMVGGVWRGADELDALLANVAQTYREALESPTAPPAG
jgi:cytosine/adenosine deaminase-related metal-dependent hydrolase